MNKLNILTLVHDHLIPPADVANIDVLEAEWKMEYDVVETLKELGHEVQVLGLNDEVASIPAAVRDFKPDIVFNLMESFASVPTFDQNIVSYLELLNLPYTGCNPRGLIMARDKALSKKLLDYHRISVPDFSVIQRGSKPISPGRLRYPLIVKSLFFEASTGISQASVVQSDDQLSQRVQFVHDNIGTAAIVEQFIPGRELYVGVIGNRRLEALPVWEMSFADVPGNKWRIATERVKWNAKYQKRHAIMTKAATLDPPTMEHIQRIAKRSCRALDLSGYARVDLRLDETAGRVYVLEVNPNPNLAYGEDLAESAEASGISYERLLDRILSLGLRWNPERT